MRRLLPILILVGCPLPGDKAEEPETAVETFTQGDFGEIDQLWVVDDSPSMQNEQEAIADEVPDLLAAFGDAGVTYHVGVMTSDMTADIASSGHLIGDPTFVTPETPDAAAALVEAITLEGHGDDKERTYEAAITGLTPPLSETVNASFLREGALLSLVVVSDENDCSDFGGLGEGATGEDCYERWDDLVPVEELVGMLRDVTPDVVVHGIVGPNVTEACADSVPGKRHFEAIARTGGVEASICDEDYGTFVDATSPVVTGQYTRFALAHPADPDTLEVEVDGAGVAEDDTAGWTYDDTYWQIVFHGDAVPPRGSTITVSYEVAGG
ncbi:MAG: hypothetical protein ACOZNI_35520 [Myxococcota bacterium]